MAPPRAAEPPLAASPPDGPAPGGGRFVTLRSLVLGLLLVALSAVAAPYWTFYLRTSRLYEDYHTAGASVFLFALLIVCNFVLGRFWRRAVLRAEELMAIGAMLLVGGSILTTGFVGYLIPTITAPHAFANEANGWDRLIWPNLRAALVPLDPNGGHVAITKFWEGIPRGEPIPWGPWFRPLAIWGVYMAAMFACTMALMAVMRKQWVDYEHLSFPIAQVPAELCAAAEPGARGGILRSPAFWIGAGLSLFAGSATAAVHYMGVQKEFGFRISQDVTFSPNWVFPVHAEPVIIGLVFLVPNRVVLSVWLLALGSWIGDTYMTANNLHIVAGEGCYGSEFQHFSFGASAVFALTSLWLSRRHLGRALKCALGVGERGYDADEPASYRGAFLVGLLGFAGAVGWFVWAGMSVLYAVPLIVVTLVVLYAMSRVVAQCGLPMLSPSLYPSYWMAALCGTANVPDKQLALMAMQYGVHFDMRNSPMSGSAHGMYLTTRRRGGLLWAMILALPVAYVCATLMTVWLCYRKGGALVMDEYFFVTFPRWLPWDWGQKAIAGKEAASVVRLAWEGIGGLMMLLLVAAQRAFFWWPLHPVGLLIIASHMVRVFWLSVFLAWLLKLTVVWAGGYRAYRVARRFLIGVVMGAFLAGGIWNIVDTITGKTLNAVFYI